MAPVKTLLIEYFNYIHKGIGPDQEDSPFPEAIDKKFSKTLGYSATVFNHISNKEQKEAMFDILFHKKKLSSLDKATVHKLYRNLHTKTYPWFKESDHKKYMKDTMVDFELSKDDIEMLTYIVQEMRKEYMKKLFQEMQHHIL